MKNLTKIFMAVVLLASYSCVQDTTVDVGGVQITNEICVSLSDANDNRTSLGDKTDEGVYPVYWSKNDKVSVNGITSAALKTADINESQTEGFFEFNGELVAPYKASYPATDVAGQVEFAASQSYVEGSFSSGAAAMYGECAEFGETRTIALQHLSGVLKFPMKAAAGAGEIALSRAIVTNPNGKLSGLYEVELVDGVPVLTPTEATKKGINYDCQGVVISATQVADLYIAVPAGEYERLNVALIAENGDIMNFHVKAAGSEAIKAGYVREFNEQTFVGSEVEFVITDSESLMEFAEMCNNNAFCYTIASLGADITFDSENYTWKSVGGYQFGLGFDGGGHTITGLTDALFDVTDGPIKNLTLVSNISISDKTLYHGILANTVMDGSITDCTTKGSIYHSDLQGDYCSLAGVVGRVTGDVTLTNVKNEASVTAKFANTAGIRPYVGGVIGVIRTTHDNIVLTNCSNSGDIVTEASDAGATLPWAHGIGGLIGGHYYATSIVATDCSNSGNITANHSSTNGSHVGGLIGSCCSHIELTATAGQYNTNSGAIVVNGAHEEECSIGGFFGYTSGRNSIFRQLKNLESGTITVNSTTSGRMNIGGVAPYVNNDGISFEDCLNYGDITVSNTSTTRSWFAIGGVIARANNDEEIATTFTNIHNHANISIAMESDPASFIAGGVLGHIQSPSVTLTNCSNNHDLTINARSTEHSYVGGVLGYSAVASEISTLTNNNALEVAGSAAQMYAAGGVVGFYNNDSAKATTLVNNGDITFSATAGNIFWFGGAAGLIRCSASDIDNHGDITYSGFVSTGKSYTKNVTDSQGCALGGTIGCAGHSVTKTLRTFDDIINTGTITITPQDESLVGSIAIGGVIGMAIHSKVTNSHFKKAEGATEAPKLQHTGLKFHNASGGGGTNHLFAIAGVIGAALADVSGANIENCTNEGTIYFDSSDYQGSHNLTIAGIAARVHLHSKGSITGCTNKGAWIISADHQGCRKSMNYGGIAGACSYAAVSGCTNEGSVLYKNKSVTVTYNYSYYSNLVGGIVGNIQECVVSECTNSGSITAEANSLNPVDNGYDGFGGIVGNSASTSAFSVENCTENGTITIDENSAAYVGRLRIGGVIGKLTYGTTKTYLVKGCTINTTISAPAETKVGLICGETYATVANCYNRTDDATLFPVMNNSIAGSIAKKDLAATTITAENFHNYIYQDVPTVDSWAENYHGNYFAN